MVRRARSLAPTNGEQAKRVVLVFLKILEETRTVFTSSKNSFKVSEYEGSLDRILKNKKTRCPGG